MWTARRILKELAGPEKRKAILSAFWQQAEATTKLTAQMQLARALKFREETIRKMPPAKKAELLASRVGAPEFDDFFEMALMLYHTAEKPEMMAAFLDLWKIPHEKGSIEADEYARPSAAEVRSAVDELKAAFDREDVVIYLATAGLLMDDAWRDGTWPVVDEMTAS